MSEKVDYFWTSVPGIFGIEICYVFKCIWLSIFSFFSYFNQFPNMQSAVLYFNQKEKWLLPTLICCRVHHLTLLSSENIIKTFYFDSGGSLKYKNVGVHFPFLWLLSLVWKESKWDWIALTGYNWFISIEAHCSFHTSLILASIITLFDWTLFI